MGEKVGITWLASYPKSGNTWVRSLLSAYANGGTLDINKLDQIGLADSHLGLWHSLAYRPFADMTDLEKVAIRSAVLLAYVNNWSHYTRSTNPIMKTHCANVAVGEHPLIPSVITRGAIYVVRDPRDVCVSWANYLGQSYEDAAKIMSEQGTSLGADGKVPQYIADWSGHVKTWHQRNNILTVRYEDLVDAPKSTVKGMLKHLGWPVDNHHINTAIEAASIERLQKQEKTRGFRENVGQTQHFFRKGGYGQWRQVLPRGVVERIEREHGDVMRDMGYTPSIHEAAA